MKNQKPPNLIQRKLDRIESKMDDILKILTVKEVKCQKNLAI